MYTIDKFLFVELVVILLQLLRYEIVQKCVCFHNILENEALENTRRRYEIERGRYGGTLKILGDKIQ